MTRTKDGAFPLSLWNVLRTIYIYNQKKPFRGLNTPKDFISGGQELLSPVERTPIRKACGLWFLERLAREARKFDNAAFLLKEKSLERFKPILHVGWGMDCLADTGFDYSRFTRVIEEIADPAYRLLALEPIGVIYFACRRPLRSALIGIRIPPVPGEQTFSEFMQSFTQDETRIISHGYGRGMYFRSMTLHAALQRTLDCPAHFDRGTALRGLAFAYTMVNCPHLNRVFQTAQNLQPLNPQTGVHHYFTQGIASALSFLEWHFPGLLPTLPKNIYTQQARQFHATHHNTAGIHSL